jgi:hypothetical protein
MLENRLGTWSATAMVVIGMAYFVTLVMGVAIFGLRPITDPVLAVMEILTLLAAPTVVVLMGAIHGIAPATRKAYGVLAVAFASVFAALTSAVHFVELTAIRRRGTGRLVWPSPAYAVELLAWDVFLGVALLFAGAVFGADASELRVRRSLVLAGSLCLLGTIGPAAGNMRLQLVGVVGYAVVFPVSCFFLARRFRTGQGEARGATWRGDEADEAQDGTRRAS